MRSITAQNVLIFFVVCFSTLCMPTTGFPQQLAISQTGPYFGVGIEQYGRVIPITDHEVILDRESFTIVLTFIFAVFVFVAIKGKFLRR